MHVGPLDALSKVADCWSRLSMRPCATGDALCSAVDGAALPLHTLRSRSLGSLASQIYHRRQRRGAATAPSKKWKKFHFPTLVLPFDAKPKGVAARRDMGYQA